MGRIGEHFATTASELQDLIPDLNRVRDETLSVLFGDTATAADDQFSMLFDGDYSVDKLSQGTSALGSGAQDLSVQIEYSKLSIIVGLALAAVEISWCLANSPETGGASLSWIPPIEWTTMTSIRRLVTTVLENIAKKLVQMLKDTTIKDLIHHGTREAFQELAQGLAQEGITQGIQVGEGRAKWRPDLFRQNAIASFAGGAAGGGTALPTGHFLGRAESKLGRATKGMTTMFTAGISGNVAGTAVVGGDFDTIAVIAGSAGSSIGGVKGLGHGSHGENESNTPGRGEPPPADPRPEGSRTPDTPIDPLDDSESQDGDSPESERRPDTSAVNGNGHAAAQGGRTARVSDSSSSGAAPAAAKQTNGVAAQKDSSASTPPTTGEDRSDSDTDGAAHDGDAPKRTPDEVASPSHTPEGTRQVDPDTVNEPTGHRPSAADPITGETPPAQHAHAPEVAAHTDPSQSAVEPVTAPSTDAASVVDPVVPSDTSPSIAATPSAVQGAPAAAAPSATSPAHTSASAAAPPTHNPTQAAAPTPKQTGPERIQATSTPSASTSEASSVKPPAARVQDTTAAKAKPSAQPSDGEQAPVARSTTSEQPGPVPDVGPAMSDTNGSAPRRADCVDRVAQALSRRHGRPIRLAPFSTAEGAPARVLYETFRSRAEFASYRKIARTLQRLGPGSSAIVTSSWAGGPGRGGHAYLAINEGGRIYLDDPFTGARTGWPPHWGRDAVSRVAVGYLHPDGSARHELGSAPRDLAAAIAVGDVQGHPGGADHDPGARWRDVTPQRRLADDALTRRGVRSAGELRNPLGLMEAADERARQNTTWWNELSGDEQRALLDIYPHEIGNAEGIPASARHEANTRALDQQRRELQDWRDRGHRLTRFQRHELARLERVQHALDRATVMADEAGVGRPQLLAFDSGAFGGSGRAVVSFGADPYKADLVAWHVPGQGMTVDQVGPCMGDALNHLRSIRAEDSSVSASTIAWIGYDTPSGWNSWRAAGHTLAREGAKILYSDIRSFNAARDTLAGDGSHFSNNHIFAHSYGSTTASYAGQDGRLANDIRTMTLAGSPGVGPLRHASDFGIGADNVFVASSSRDPFTALGGRRPGSLGRIFGLGLGMDPAMESFGAHRVTAEFSGALDHRGTRFTHNSYFRFEDRGTDPPVRSESLANFGRIATGHVEDRVDTEAHRTIDERPRRHLGGTRERTVEPAAERPLDLDGDTERHRGARGLVNPRWRGEQTSEHPASGEHALDHDGHSPEPIAPLDTRSDEDIANDLLRDRGISADDLVNPYRDKDPALADARARQNAAWWAGLTENQRGALVRAYPQQVGSAEGIYTEHRDAANRATFKTYRDRADEIQEKINRGEQPSKEELKFLRRVNKIDTALRNGEAAAARAGVGGPKLLYFDPLEFGRDGRAIVSFGEDPYKAANVAWLVPGFGTTIDKLDVNMRNALNLLQSALREKPKLSASTIAWIGYDAPNDMATPRVARSKLARDGGEILYSDIRGFNAARDTWAGDGSQFKGNHIFGHSYGSTTTSHAGYGGRLGEHVTTITLLGSPGAGDLTHASDFGLEPGKVFVASSSWDPVTAFGGRTAGERVRILHDRFGLGLGMDPAMKSFGAVRVRAEFPLAWNRKDTVGTHTAYYQYVDPGTHPGVRNESLANFGRILAGKHDAVREEAYRTVDESGRRTGTNEPAAGRQLHLEGGVGPEHSRGREKLFLFNPRWRAADAGETRRLADLLKTFKLSDGDDVPADLPIDQIQRTIDPELARIARDLLGHRVPPVAADQLVNPLHQPGVADARARANAKWWGQLNETQRHALVHTYPNEIGNAEGIDAADRDAANREMVGLFRKRAAAVQAKITEGETVSDRDFAFLLRMNKFDTALENAKVAANRAGFDRPFLLAFDPPAFKGDGRAVLSFGDDPYTAKSVSWYVPGVGAQMDRLDYCAHAALNILQSARHENSKLSAASIAWIGYDAPNGMNTWRAAGKSLARQGGNILYSDIRAFNAARDTMAGDGSRFSGNHIFGHSYGSTTTSFAGEGGRLARHVQTITLIGSPGAGPIRHASGFKIGDNVYVASSSVDRIARLGGLTRTSDGRILGLGLGTDPAMKSFGAKRITAEFLPEMNRKDTTGTHNAYFDFLETDGPRRWLVTPHSPIRTEALANLGRIASGHTERLRFEDHRSVDRSGHRVEPAEGRRLHHDDANTRSANTDSPPGDGHRRFKLFRKPLTANDCGPRVLDELRSLYPHRRFRLRVDASPSGVPARHLFLAARSGSRFATYDEVARQLQELGRGSSALLVSRWSGDGRGGHAYLAINTGDEIVLYDPHTQERSGWPPHWGQDAVARTAVGYLKPNGRPLDPHDLDTRKLGAADTIGRVKGMPTDGSLHDALAQRVPPVSPGELRNPVASPEEASARARANATWWKGLSDTQRQDLIDEYPDDIGNSEGIPVESRDEANQGVLRRLRVEADLIRTRIDEFGHPSRADKNFLDRVDRIDLAVRKATADAAAAGLPPPRLLALDLSEFSGRGRAVLSFGEDPYHAEKVSWHRATEHVERLGRVVRPALQQLHADHRQTGSAAAVVWVGDESKSPGALHSDVAAFHTARQALSLAETGDQFTGNRVYTVHPVSTTETAADLWVPRDEGSLVVAHRGASHEFPEQTLAAYKEALRQGADGLECDIRLTKDGQLVCIHDKRIDRTSNGTGRVRDMTLAELQQFDFGSRHPSHELGDAQGDTGILTLDELLQLVKGHEKPVTLFIEAKEHGGKLERELVALLNRHGLANPASPAQARVAVISFYPDAIWRVHRAAPDVPTVLLGSTARHLAPHVGASAIGPSIATLRAHPEIVDIAARQGLTTYCWTVNGENDVQFARDLGVGWIATDHPGRTSGIVHGDPTEPAAQYPAEPHTGTSAQDAAEHAAVEARHARAVADAALAHRIPPVRPDELRNSLGPAEESRARARNNAAWWDRLTEDQRQALIKSYPHDIGNAEGIPAAARHDANHRVVQELRDRADHVQSKIDDGIRPTRAERKLLRQVNRLDLALRKATADAERAGVGEPQLLAFDPAEFGGDGRAVLSFGADPYKADSVSWHVPGVATTVHSLFGFYTECALNHLQATLAENPNASASSIAWIGYDTPSGLGILRAAGHKLARTGGDLLHSDITAFNAARDVMAGDGSHFSGNHIFGYSYGSTTTGYAGEGGRLAGEITTVSLVGSPGAGPIRHAEAFGIGADHVFVASSSRDLVTALGGRTPHSSGRILGIGLGVDPAMDHFGAQRIAAEFPPARNQLLTGGTHHAYYLNTDTGSRVRSESLTNLGRIAAGNHEQISHEAHRSADGRRTSEPAAHRSEQRIWNPRWRDGQQQDARTDPDFIRRQDEYRAQDPANRHVDTRYADPLGDVVDNPTQDGVNRLARDLSGTYGPYRIQLGGEVVNGEVLLTGHIFHGDTEIGTIQRFFYRAADGNLVADHLGLVIREELDNVRLRGRGFSKALSAELERYYVHSGVDRIGLHTHDLGGFAWARRGFTWDPNPRAMQRTFDAIKGSVNRLRDHVGPEARAALDNVVRQLEPTNPRLPEPIDVANLATPDEPELGRRLLDGLASRRDGTGLDLVKYMPRETHVRPPNGFGARLKRLFRLGGDPRPDQDCAHRVADELSTRYYGRDFTLPAARSHMGTPAWTLFETARARAEFARYDDVPGRLRALGDGSSAILVSRWAGGRAGGHAYLAVNDGGEIYLHDPDTGERSAWPPHWGEDAVSHTAAGYLKPDGSPEYELNADPLQQQLADADLVGDVRGHPGDSEFMRRQADYRAQDLTIRHVDTRYAEPLGDVVDDRADGMAAARRLGDDLSGVYGPYRIRYDEVFKFDNEVRLSGDIYHGDTKIGRSGWIFHRAPDGHLVVTNSGLVIDAKFKSLRGQGFSRTLTSELERYFVQSGVDRIELHTHDKGGYAWPRMGYTWHPGSRELHESIDQVRSSAIRLKEVVGAPARAVLDDIMQRLDPNHPRLPEPSELANLTAAGEPELGRRLMEGSSRLNHGLNLVRYMPRDVADGATAQSHRGFGARLRRMIGLGRHDQSDQDCAHQVADELSAIYRDHGRDFRVATARSPMGTPAWALFDAINARPEFATYADVTAKLRPGWTAVLTSRWADGRSGGHAYLAVHDGHEISLYDPHTGERSGWPPHWGQDAVGRTAVAYLKPDGSAEHTLNDSPLQRQLAPADAVGDVRGHPSGPDFVRRQEEYRSQDPATRRVDSRYADPLGPAVDSASSAGAGRLAEDLSGVYGPYRLELEGLRRGPAQSLQDGGRPRVVIEGAIFDGNRDIGDVAWSIYRDDDGSLVAHHELYVGVDDFRGWEFSKALNEALAPYYVRNGVDQIVTTTLGESAYAAADLGHTWDPDPESLQISLDHVKESARLLSASLDDEARAVLDQIVQRLEPWHPRLPEPADLAHLTTFGEPELGRRLLEGTGSTPDGTGSGLNYVKYLWSSRLQSDQNCASWVAEALSDRYGTPVSLDTPPAAEGVAARALFEAAGSRAEFATYDEIAARLLQMDPGKPGEPGPAAIVVSSWAGGESRGGHAYLAVRDGDRISLLDPFTGERSGWPPFWGESAVSRTAVGFFTSEGLPAQQLDGSAHELAAADAVGDVRGHPDDPEFLRRQADYRAQDPTSRTVDTRYAEPLADIVDNAPDLARVRQLADDLSGVFGPYRVEQFRAEVSLSNEVIVGGHIFSGDEYVGFMQRTFVRDVDGHLVAHHNVVEIDQERFKFKGFSRALSAQLEAYYERSGVDRIELRTEQDGGHVWAKRGFTWNTDPAKLRESLQSVKDAADRLYNWVSDDAKALLRRTVARLDPAHPRLPEPAELAALAVADEPDLGRQLMYGTQWHGVKHLRGAATESTTLLHSESDATVGRSVEDGAELRGANCAHLVAHELWEMYELEIELDPPTASGVPARALFEATGTTAQFATYDEVANELRRLGPGSSAILASRWAGGRQGGHAYLAVNVGGDVFLVESHSGRQLGWPPYWGEDAVARTAVGYLDPDGVPPPGHELTPDIPLRLQLADAAAIGDVQGLPTDGVTAHADAPGGRYPSPDDVELAEFRDRIGQLDPSTMTPEAIADALYQPVPIDDVTGFYEGRVSGFKTGEVIRAQHHVADSRDNAVFVSADIANLRGLNQASADRVEANAHFSALADIFHAGLVDSGADVVPMRVGGDELAAIVVGDIDEETIDSAVEAIRARVQEYARQHNLSDIPHPKHPGQPEYNGVGLHIGHADVLPGLDVRDVFNLADLGVDESKTRRSDVAGGPGRATGADGAEPGGAGAAHRGAATRTDSEAAGRAGEVGGRTRTEGEAGRSLAGRVRYRQPEELKRAAFLEQAARIDRDAAPEALLALRESLRTDEVSGFYDGRAAAFKTGEVARARQWAAETGGTGFLLSAQMDNLSGLNQHTQNRAEVANAHYRAITEIFRTEIEATGATVVPMRTGGDRFDAIVVGRLDAAEVDAAIAAINDKVAAYTAREGLSDIANPSNPEQRGVSLRFGYADITAHRDVEGIVQSAERQMFGRNDSGDPRRVPVLEPDVEIPTPRQPAAAEDLPSPRTQEEYRAQDRTTRTTDTRFAEPLEDVLDNSADQRTVDQFAEDFSGVYGPYRVAFRAEGDGDVFLSGVIFRGTSPIGEVQLDFFRDPDGALVASVDWIEIFNDKLRQAGFSRSLIRELERYCRSSDVTQIRLAAQNNGGIAWARTGFTWDREPERLEKSLDSIKASAQRLRSELTGDARTVLDGIVDRLDPNRSDVPEPKFLTELTTRDVPDLGSRLMDGTEWFAVMNLQAADNHVQVSPENVFARTQDEYRGQDRAARVVDTRHADPLGDVVDNIEDVARVRQLAADLSGVYGPYRVELAVSVSDLEVNGKVVVRGEILKGAKPIGAISHSFFRDVDGKLVAHHDLVTIRDPKLRQKGFSSALYSELERYYVRSGVDRIELLTAEKGGFVWALRGFTWDPDPGRLRRSLDSIKESAQKLRDVVGPQGRAALDEVVRQLNPRNPRLPEPRDLAALATADEPELGHKLLEGTHWRAVRHLPTADVDVQSHSGLGARLKRLFHLGGRPRTDQHCAHAVADELSAIYKEKGREFGLAPSRSPMGTPAWALFKAAGTQAQFTDYDKVTETLRPGWTAILTSRWADGRSGGHTYLAVHDGVGVYLYDPETGQRSGWPPHWGEDAVARTAVGYLDENGIAVHPLGDVPLQLDLKAADVIGDVQGHPVEGGAQQQFAEEALSQRIPPVSAADLVHPIGDARLAVERAQANAIWWQGITQNQRQAMVENHPFQIGNAEGIPPSYRHEANSRALQDWLRDRGPLQARRDAGFRLGYEKQRQLNFFNGVDDAMQRGAAAARRVGVGGPYLLRFDPMAFDGNGIAIVGFGVDPHLAESVSWHIPGRGAAIDELGAAMGSALNQLSSVLLEDPAASAASITWIGYHTVVDQAAKTGGENLYSDIRAFNAGRDAWAVDGSHFTNNHVYGHCQGSTVVGYAGVNARLDRVVRTVVLFGSPGMGPINHADEFGPGVDVFAAASSADPFTWDAGHTPGSRGVFLNGFGVDPAMDFFGARRITAEFPLTRMLAAAPEYDPHNWYYKFDDKPAGLRTESLANFGRIAVGHLDRVGLERHRTVVRPDQDVQVREPAAVRPAVDDLRPPPADPADNCAYGVAGLVSTRYSRSDIRIDVQPAPTGVPARALYEALGSRAEFMDYTRVAETLRPGWSAILTSTWAGVRHGGHAYLAVNDGGTIYLVDPRTGRRSGWPPYWGERAVAQTAVGFLDENGDPVHRLDGSPDELASADTIGDVQGGPTDPASQLGLPDYEPRSLSDVDAHTVYTHGEHRMRELNDQLLREGVNAEDRARILFEQRNSLRAWTRDLMSNQTTAAVLAAHEGSHSFADLVARQEERGLTGDAVFEAIIETATHSRFAPGTLSDVETSAVYREFEDRMREFNERLTHEGVSVEERARKLSEVRNSLRAWTRELMSNRVGAEFLASHESTRSFDDLVARNEAKGLVGDDVYEAIIHTAINSHYGLGTLDSFETRTVYTNAELLMRQLNERLIDAGASIEERARIMSALRASVRTWTRELMADRVQAETLHTKERNPSFEDLVAKERARGREGDEIYQAIIESSTRSRPSVNEFFGIDPDNPPPLPPMRGGG